MSKRITDAHLMAIYESQYRYSGMTFPEFRDTYGKNQTFLAALARLQTVHSANPYPEAITPAEKISAHYDELSFLLSERIASQLEGKSSIDAQRIMNERYITSVLDAQLDNMTSGVDATDFFEKLGIDDPVKSYQAFKKDMVGAVARTWEDYLQKPHVTRFSANHMRDYFAKHLGDNLQVPVSRLTVGRRDSSDSVGKRMPRTAKLGAAAAPAIESPMPTGRKFKATQEVGREVFDDEEPIGEASAKIGASSRVFAVSRKAEALDASIGTKSFTKQRKPTHQAHHEPSVGTKSFTKQRKPTHQDHHSLLEHLHHRHDAKVNCQSIDCLLFRANRKKWQYYHKNHNDKHSSSEEEPVVMPPPLAPRSEPAAALPEPTEDSELSASGEDEVAMLDEEPSSAPETTAAAAPSVASRAPRSAQPRPSASIAVGMLESYAKSNPDILSGRRIAFFAPVDSVWESTPAPVLKALQAKPKNFLDMHTASPVPGVDNEFLSLTKRSLSLGKLLNHKGQPGDHSVERVNVAGKPVTLIYLGQLVPRN